MPSAGTDVSKNELVIYFEGRILTIANEKKAIRKALRSLPEGCRVGVESTARFHELFVKIAYEMGFEVYVVNPKELSYYRRSIEFRVKSDLSDAAVLARFVELEHQRLFRYYPPEPRFALVHAFLSHRATLVRARVAAASSLQALPREVREHLESNPLSSLDQAIEELENKIHQIMALVPAYKKLQAIPGIARLSAAALICAFSRGTFTSSDSFVAYAGLDLQVCESGGWRGRRRLTKRGDRLLRCMLFLAATSAVRTSAWKGFYQNALAKGWKKIQSIIVVARKMLRLAWSMLRHESDFNLSRLVRA